MSDVFSKKKRSSIMSKVPSKNTSLEHVVRKYLFSQGQRYSIHCKQLPGKPDIYVRKYNTAIFVNGCFWHGHKRCKLADLPTSHITYWEKKINKNMARDVTAKKELRLLRIKTLTVWGCQLSGKKRNKTLVRLLRRLVRRAS